MIKNIKKILKDDTKDYAYGLVNPKQFYQFYYFYLKVFYLLDDEPLPKFMKYIHPFLVLNGLVANVLFGFGLYNAIHLSDIVLIAEWGAYTMIFACYLLILSCQVLNVQYYRNLTKSMSEDFNYVCSDGERYRERYFKSQIETRKIVLLCWCFTTATGVSMVSFTTLLLVLHFITRDPDGDKERPLLFPLWILDIDFHKTPYFEIFFTYSNFLILCFAFVYGFSLQTETLWVRQMSSKVDLIKYCIEDLCEGIALAKTSEQISQNSRILKLRLRIIIRHHLSLFRTLHDFANVYKKVLMLEQAVLPYLVCLTSYGSAEKLAMGEIHFILLLLTVAASIVVLISSYLCTFLRVKVQSISETALDTPFWRTGAMVRPYLVLIMQRTIRPLPLQAPGFEEISLQTFSKKMVSAYSMFNTLRQTSVGK